MGGERLVTALPSMVIKGGFMTPRIRPSQCTTLRRTMRFSGPEGFTRSRMIEDMGAAEPRYEMANMLRCDERALPTDCVHYDLPYGIWMPALIRGKPGAVRWKDNRIWIWGEAVEGDRATDATYLPLHEAEGRPSFFGGRSVEEIRPTCAFYRRGTAVHFRLEEGQRLGQKRPRRAEEEGDDDVHVFGVVDRFDPKTGRYEVLYYHQEEDGASRRHQQHARIGMTPYEVDEHILCAHTPLVCRVEGLRFNHNNNSAGGGALLELHDAEGGHYVRVAGDGELLEASGNASMEVIGKLEYARVDHTTMEPFPQGCIVIRIRNARRAAAAGNDHGGDDHYYSSYERTEDGRLRDCSNGSSIRAISQERKARMVCVDIRAVARIGEAADMGTVHTFCQFVQSDE